MEFSIRMAREENAESIVELLNPIIQAGTYTIVDEQLSVDDQIDLGVTKISWEYPCEGSEPSQGSTKFSQTQLTLCVDFLNEACSMWRYVTTAKKY